MKISSLILMVYRHRKLGYPKSDFVADGQARWRMKLANF